MTNGTAAPATDKKADPKIETAPLPALTVPQKKALFDKYEAIAAREKALDDQADKIRKEKSAAIKEIEEMLGKGPFEWKGDVLIITKREDTYYFRSRGKTEVEKIG